MRAYLTIVILLVLAFFISPLTHAAGLDLEKGLHKAFEQSRSFIERAQKKLADGRSISTELDRLKTTAEHIKASHLLLRERFRLRQEQVSGMGGEAAEHHRLMSESFMEALEQYLMLVESLSDERDPESILNDIKILLDKILYKKKPLIFGTLPYRHLNYPAKEPIETPAIIPSYKGGNRSVSPDDLEGTPEAPISEQIAALAESLEWNPVLIYEWVKNNIETEWYWGCMKGAEETLRQKSGNDCDQAALLIALLRSAGFPSRYVRGVVEFFPNIETVQNLTGVEKPQEIAAFFQKAGIPYKPVVTGGKIANFQIEHIWVESLIPFANFHGAVVDEHGKVWIGLDTSIKVTGYTYNDPVDMFDEFSLSDIRDNYLSTLREETPLEYIKTEIEAYLEQTDPNISYEDLLRTKTLVPEVMSLLPASLQFKQIHISHEYTALPDDLIHKVRFKAADTSGTELFDFTIETFNLSNRQIAVTYEPQTVEDQEIINSFGGLDNTPAYLVRLRPTLQLNGENTMVVATGGLPIGAEYDLSVELISPHGSESTTNTHITGNYAVIGIVAEKAVTPQTIPDEEKDAWRVLYEEAIHYIDQWNRAEEELAALMHVSIVRPIPTVITLGGVIDVTYLLDTPHGFEWKGLYVDADLRAIDTTVSNDQSDDRQRLFMALSSLQGSILENKVLEDAFQVDSISTATVFQLANDSQVPILIIDSDNIDSVLPTLTSAEEIKDDITNAVNQRLVVQIPQAEISYQNWTGIGYIKDDPETGASGWMLSGTIAGGMTAGTWSADLLSKFTSPYSKPPNDDPASAFYIYKVPDTDMQKGTVGEKLAKPLTVMVFDRNGSPVKDAVVYFTVKAGGGQLYPGGVMITDAKGIASVELTLGQNTGDNPTYVKTSNQAVYHQQVGENIVDASLDTTGGSIKKPFTAYGFPKDPVNLQKQFGDLLFHDILSFSGFVSVKVEDVYGNPISNVPVEFTAWPPIEQVTCNNPNQDTRPALLIQQNDPCMLEGVFPTWGECYTENTQIQDVTDILGVARAHILMGGVPQAEYPIEAAYQNLTTTFQRYSNAFGNCDQSDAEPAIDLHVQYIYPADSFGKDINGVETGTEISVKAKMFYQYEIDAEGTDCGGQCSKVIGARQYDVDTLFESASVTVSNQPCNPLGAGIFECKYTVSSGLNTITIDGTATVSRNRYDNACPDCGPLIEVPITQSASTTMGISGVDVDLVLGPEDYILVDDRGYTLKDHTLSSTILPFEYQAGTAYVVIEKDGKVDQYIETGTSQDSLVTLLKGYYFDWKSTYTARVVLNAGKVAQHGSLEIWSKEVPLQIFSTRVTAGNVKLTTNVDRINGKICDRAASLRFVLASDADVTIEVDGAVIDSTVNQHISDTEVTTIYGAPVPINGIPIPAGINEVFITREMVPLPGEHDFKITAVFREGNPNIESTANGKIIHNVVINEVLPIGHTFVKGVNLHDGHLAHSTQDVGIPGRGLSLDFTRTYGSVGNSSDGPIGAGWTHSYNVRIIHDACGWFVVKGGEGTGNAFTSPYKDPAKAALFNLSPAVDFFRPQIGYHSTLVRNPQEPSKLDFFTKSHVRYHFEIDPAYVDEITFSEIYTLRYIEEPNGNRITLDYVSGDADPETLDTVTDSSGRALVFEYEPYDSIDPYWHKRISRLTGQNNQTGSDFLGLEITYEYDGQNNLTKVTRKSPDPGANLGDERVETYTYTLSGAFQQRHNMLTYTDPNGNTTEYVYYDMQDSISGFAPSLGVEKYEIVKSVIKPEGVITDFHYDFNNKTREVSDPRPDVGPTIYTLNDYGATVQIEEPMGKTSIQEWCTDTPHPSCNGIKDVLMVSTTDAEGRTTEYEYLDGLGNLTRETVRFTGGKASVTLKDGVTPVSEISTSYSYDPLFSKMTSRTDPEGNTTLYQIESNSYSSPTFCAGGSGHTGNVLGMQNAVGNVTCYAYYANGDLETITDPRGFLTRFESYDTYGNADKIIGPEGNEITIAFDERSRLSESFDTFTHHVKYGYDGLDRRISEERLDDQGEGGTPQVMAYLYKPNGELKEVVDGLGQTTANVYDSLNRLVEQREEGVLQADGTSIALRRSFAHDENNNLICEVDPRGFVRKHTYDELNRRVETRISDSPLTGSITPAECRSLNPVKVLLQYSYDLMNNKLSETDLHEHTTTYVYDGLYRLVETRLPFAHNFTGVPFQEAIIKTAYDRMGNKVLETDANGQATTFEYDDVYRMERKTDADGNAVTFAYDQSNNKVEERNLSSGLITEWRNPDYDGLNRPKVMRQTVPLGGAGLQQAVFEAFYDYEDSDNAVVETNPRGFKTRTDKDGLDRVFQSIVDVGGLDLATTFTYDGSGNVKTVTDPQGGDIDVTNEYDGLNRKIRSTYVSTADDGGVTVEEKFAYDGNSNRTRYEDRRGIVFTTTYDSLNRTLVEKVMETISNSGTDLALKIHAYDDAHNTVTGTDANGNQTITHFDELHRPVKIDDPDPSGFITYSYDGVNKRVESDKEEQRTEYDYDTINRLVETREFDTNDILRTTLSADYLDENNRVEETDRRGITTVRQLDALQRHVHLKRKGLDMASQYGVGEVLLETNEYDGNGNEIAFIDGQGNRTKYTYDGADRQIFITEGVGSPVEATTATTYDNVGNVLIVKDGRSHGGEFDMQYTYDARYRRKTATNGEGETTTSAYDANDNMVHLTEPNGQAFTTLYEYDELNTLLAVDETPRMGSSADAGVTLFFYDGNRNKIAQQDANGNLVTYKYDGLNRLTDTYQHTVPGALSDSTVRGSDPDGSSLVAGGNVASALHWGYTYDLNSNNNLIIDARGQRVNMNYDYLDRLETKTYSQHAEPDLDFQKQSIEYQYDDNSNVTCITEIKHVASGDVTELTVNRYDPLDRIGIRVHRDYDDTADQPFDCDDVTTGKRIEYDYDIQGNRVRVIDSDGIKTKYEYDERNRLKTVLTEEGLPTEAMTGYTWWEDNLLRQITYPNATVADRSASDAYDRADRVVRIVNRPADPSLSAFSVYEYTYDDNGNRTQQFETQAALNGGVSETTTYTYDRLNRLQSVAYGNTPAAPTLTYTYAPNGNRLAEVGTDPMAGQQVNRVYQYEALSGKAGVTFSHVNTLTRMVDLVDPSRTVTYEYDRNLNQITKEKGGTRTEYNFGISDQILFAHQPDGATVRFDYDHDRLRVKKISSGSGKDTRYLYDQNSVLMEYDGTDATLPTFHKYDYGYELLALTQVTNASQSRDSEFYLTDGLMSTVNLTDEAGELKQSYLYDAWGRMRDQSGTSDNPRQYTGHYKDAETGLHYFGARYYDDETGRFLSQDPYLGEANNPPSLHRYLYAYANPVRYVDLRGYQPTVANEGDISKEPLEYLFKLSAPEAFRGLVLEGHDDLVRAAKALEDEKRLPKEPPASLLDLMAKGGIHGITWKGREYDPSYLCETEGPVKVLSKAAYNVYLKGLSDIGQIASSTVHGETYEEWKSNWERNIREVDAVYKMNKAQYHPNDRAFGEKAERDIELASLGYTMVTGISGMAAAVRAAMAASKAGRFIAGGSKAGRRLLASTDLFTEAQTSARVSANTFERYLASSRKHSLLGRVPRNTPTEVTRRKALLQRWAREAEIDPSSVRYIDDQSINPGGGAAFEGPTQIVLDYQAWRHQSRFDEIGRRLGRRIDPDVQARSIFAHEAGHTKLEHPARFRSGTPNYIEPLASERGSRVFRDIWDILEMDAWILRKK